MPGRDRIISPGVTAGTLSLLLAAFPAAAQQDADGEILTNIGLNSTAEKEFLLTSAVACGDDSYSFLLTSDSTFVSLPVDTIEMSATESTPVRVAYDSNRLDPGTHTANITVHCSDCGRCRVRDKILRVVLTVVAEDAGIVDNTVETVIELVVDEADLLVPDLIGAGFDEAIEQLQALDLQVVLQGGAITRTDLLTVMTQQPAAGEIVETGTLVTLTTGVRVPDLTGLTTTERQRRIDERGLLLATSTAADATTAAQTPLSGAIVAVGTSVTLILPVVGSTSLSGAWLAAIVLLVTAVILILFWRWSAKSQATATAGIEVRSSPDAGEQRAWSDGTEPQRPVIRVRLAGDAGEQSVEGDPAAITEREWK